MKTQTQKFLAAAVGVMTLTALLSGCGSPGTSTSPGTNAAKTETAAQFYQGKTLQIIVPYGPGGGYDQWARLIAPYFKKYLGLASVDVVNAPGGGGLVGTNQTYSAKADGLTIGDTNAGGDVFDQISGAQGVNFDVTKMNWIGRPDNDPHIIAVHTKGSYQSFTDLEHASTTIKALATGKGSSDYNAAVITFNAFGMKYNMIAAFSGSKAEKAAFLRGNGDTISLSASDIHQVANIAKVTIVLSTKSFSKLPNVPTVIDLAQQAGLSQAKIDALTALSNVMELGHAFIAPPNIPADRLKALQDAFAKALQDPDFIAQAQKSKLYLGYKSGSDLVQMVQQAMTNGPQLKPLLAAK